MLLQKDGITTGQLIELLQYSREERCQFFFRITNSIMITPLDQIQKASAIRILKLDQVGVIYHHLTGSPTCTIGFNIKIMIEDTFYEISHGTKERVLSGVTPAEIANRVNEILTANQA